MEQFQAIVQEIIQTAIKTKINGMFLTFVGGGLFGVLSFMLGKYYG